MSSTQRSGFPLRPHRHPQQHRCKCRTLIDITEKYFKSPRYFRI